MTSTRPLVMAALRARQPTLEYEIRRELESWGAESWVNIAYGSIYYTLEQMAREGLTEPADEPDTAARPKGRPAGTAYVLTAAGEEEFQRPLRETWWEFAPVADPFQAALAVMDSSRATNFSP